MTYNKFIALASVLTMMLTAVSCEKQMFVLPDCSECYAAEPESAFITVKIKENPEYYVAVTINVYEGDDTKSPLIYSYVTYTAIPRIDVALNRTYTIEAIYRIDSKTYRAIDSVRPALKYSKYDCDEPCWYIYNNKADVRLKYF